jgi:hypothetical protein
MGWRERIFGDSLDDAERAAMLAEGGDIAAEVPPRPGMDITNALALGGLDGLASQPLIGQDANRFGGQTGEVPYGPGVPEPGFRE